jgi:DNA-binding NarL/FixJ family response regulator
VGEAGNGQETLAQARSAAWSLLLLDLSMPPDGGLDILAAVRRDVPALPVLIFSMHGESKYGVKALRQGAAGYLVKEAMPEALGLAIQRVLDGGRYVSDGLAELLVFGAGDRRHAALPEHLTQREYQVMIKLSQGRSVKEIAAELGVNHRTVQWYRACVLQKLRLHSTSALIHYAISRGLLNEEA